MTVNHLTKENYEYFLGIKNDRTQYFPLGSQALFTIF